MTTMSNSITVADVKRIAATTDYVFNAEEQYYVDYHGKRIAAILGLVTRFVREAVQSGRRPVKVLDIGPHFLTRCMHDLFGDDVVVDTLGFQYHGMVPEAMVAEHYEFDLNRAQHREQWLRARGHDVIVMAEVIEHLYTSPNLVLQFLRSLLVDRGVLIVQTPNAVSLRRRLGMLTGHNPFELIRDNYTNPGHFREYTADELCDFCRNNGFDDPVVVKQNYWPTAAFYRLAGAVFPNLREGLLIAAHRAAHAGLDAPRAVDSTARSALSADFDFRIEQKVRLGESIRARARIRNTGTATWLPENGGVNGLGVVRLGGRILDLDGRPRRDFFRQPISVDRPVPPGAEVELQVEIKASELGVWQVEFDLVAEGVAWFQETGGRIARHTFEVV